MKSGEWSAYFLSIDCEETSTRATSCRLQLVREMPERWSLMGRSVTDNWMEFCQRYVEVAVGLGRDVESIESEKRYIGPMGLDWS